MAWVCLDGYISNGYMSALTSTPMSDSLEIHIERFLRQKRLEVSSPASMEDITYFTNLIVEGFTTLFPDLTLKQLTSAHILSYIEWLESEQSGHRLSKATIKKKAVMYLKHFLGRLCEEGELDRNPAATVRYRPRVKYTATPRIARHHLVQLYKALAGDDYRNILMRAVIHLFLDTGLRNDELCRLIMAQLDLPGQRIHLLTGKGGKTAPMGFGPRTRLALSSYLAVREGVSSKHGERLFLNSKGGCLTPTHLDKLLKRYASLANIPSISAHQFRVTFAVELFLKGESPFTVQAALRHATLDMTYHYMRLAEQERTAVRCAIANLSDDLLGTDTPVASD